MKTRWPELAVLAATLLILAAVRVERTSAAASATADFYVATDGNDRWSGRLPSPNTQKTDGPFASPARAREAIRSLKKQSRGRTKITVMFRGGTYFLDAPLALGPDDSGTPGLRIVYQAYPNETPVLSGGRPISGWTRNGGEWQTSVHLDYFEQLWVNGQRRLRPRTTKGGYLYNAGPVYSSESSEACTAPRQRRNFGGMGGGGGRGLGRRPFQRSRFPGGVRPTFPNQAGSNQAGQAGGEAGDQPGRPSPAPPPPPGQNECFDRFYYKGDDVQPGWHNLDDVEILDFEDWTMSRMRLKSVDTASHIAYLTGPTNRAPRFFGFLPGHRYLVENVREALSQPGEWYLERSDGRLTYLAEPGEDPATAVVIAPQLAGLISARGLSDVTFKGLTFSYTNWTVPADGYRSSDGELRVPAALNFLDSSSIVIDGCVISHTGGWGIDFRGTGPWNPADGYNDRVANSVLTDLGAGGIRIGYEPGLEDAESNVAQHVLVENDVISGGGRMLAEGAGIWIGNAHDNVIRHNEISDFYNNGINLGHSLNYVGGLTHDNLIEFNDLHQLGQGVTDDIGAVHAVTSTTTGNKILNNKMHDITSDPGHGGYGGWAIYFDQGTSNALAKDNLVYRVSQAGFHQNTGQNNTVTNNIFAFGALATVERSNNEEHLSFSFTHNIVYGTAGSPLRGFWLCRDRQTMANVPCSSRFAFDSNLYWNPSTRRVTFEAGRNPLNPELLALPQWQALGEDAHSLVADPLFVNPNYPADNFRLRPDSPATRVGFLPFDPDQSGRLPGSGPEPSPLRPAYPLQVPDPSHGY